MDISSEENQGKIDIIKNKLDKNLLSDDQIKDYYKNDELVIIRDDVDIQSDDIFKEIKKKYLNKTGKIVHTMLHDGLVRIHIPNKKYDLYWNYKECIPVKLLEDIPSPSYEPKDTERVLESDNRIKFIKVAIIINSDNEAERVQNILFNNGYKWGTYGNRSRIFQFEIYPTVIFAYIHEMLITMMELDLSRQYYRDNLEELESGEFGDTFYKLYNINMLNEYTNLIKFKKETPSYKPRKRIERTLESRNSIETATEICIKIDNKGDLKKFEKLIIPYKIDFEITNELSKSKIDDISEDRPIWMFIDFNDNSYVTHLTLREWQEDGKEPGDMTAPMCNGVWERVLDINRDLLLIERILKEEEIKLLPDYRPRKINRTLEMNNLKKYDDFSFDRILEDVESGDLPLVLSQRLRDILKEIDHPISEKLLDTDIDEDQSFKFTLVDITDDNDKFSVGSSNKITDLLSDKIKDFDSESFTYFTTDPTSEYIWNKFRSVVKIGRLIRKLFPGEFQDNGKPGEDIESFVNLYKTDFTDIKELFDVVKGDDIVHWYKLHNYVSDNYGSILYSSCMADGCDEYIKFYALNPKKVSMLILYEDDEKELIVGRALLWNIDEIDGDKVKRVFMDRIYTSHEYQINYFINHALKNDYLYKESQSADDVYIIDPLNNSNGELLDLSVYNVNPSRYYPYLDTLKYYSNNKKILSNNNNDDDMALYLIETDGEAYNAFYSKKYKRWINEDDENYVECTLSTHDLKNDERYFKKEDAIFMPYYEEWIPKNRYENNVIKIDIGGDEEILKKDAVHLKFYGGITSKRIIKSSYDWKKSRYYDDYLLIEDTVRSHRMNDNIIKDKAIKVYHDITKTGFDYLPDNSDELQNMTYSIKGDYIFRKNY